MPGRDGLLDASERAPEGGSTGRPPAGALATATSSHSRARQKHADINEGGREYRCWCKAMELPARSFRPRASGDAEGDYAGEG